MANNPKKVKDPTEVALSAIQEALNISDVPADDNARSSVRSDVTPTNSSSTSDYDESAFDTRPSADRPTFEPIEEQRPARRAANDDRETIGQILQAIQKGRPARNVYTLATLFAAVSGSEKRMATSAIDCAIMRNSWPRHDRLARK